MVTSDPTEGESTPAEKYLDILQITDIDELKLHTGRAKTATHGPLAVLEDLVSDARQLIQNTFIFGVGFDLSQASTPESIKALEELIKDQKGEAERLHNIAEHTVGPTCSTLYTSERSIEKCKEILVKPHLISVYDLLLIYSRVPIF